MGSPLWRSSALALHPGGALRHLLLHHRRGVRHLLGGGDVDCCVVDFRLSTFDSSSTKDNFIPLFSGQPSEYKEWRKRILIYQHKMVLAKRASEGVLNLIGSQTGTAWSLLEDFPLKDLELESTFNAVLKILDAAFQYDDRVQLPSDFEAYFMRFQRRGGQTLLAYCTEHEELIKRLDRHKVTLPATVQGWLILRRAGRAQQRAAATGNYSSTTA